MFRPLEWVGLLDMIADVRQMRLVPSHQNVPEWMIYSLPDGLWLLSYLYAIEYIWYDEQGGFKSWFLSLMPVAIVLWEVAQYFGLVPGTWDVMDCASYVISVVIYLTTKLCQNTHRK